MNAVEKRRILALVADYGLPRRRALAQLGLPKSTYYRWLKRKTEGELQNRRGGSQMPWNKLSPGEEEKILVQARASPELIPRELGLRIIDREGLYVSESSVYRLLKREGLIKAAEVVGFKAGKEYHRKTNRPNQLWATDCAHPQGDRLGLVLPGYSPGRLQPFYTGLGAQERHDSTIADRRRAAGGGPHWYDRRAG